MNVNVYTLKKTIEFSHADVWASVAKQARMYAERGAELETLLGEVAGINENFGLTSIDQTMHRNVFEDPDDRLVDLDYFTAGAVAYGGRIGGHVVVAEATTEVTNVSRSTSSFQVDVEVELPANGDDVSSGVIEYVRALGEYLGVEATMQSVSYNEPSREEQLLSQSRARKNRHNWFPIVLQEVTK